MMKRMISLILVMLMTLALLTGCRVDMAARIYEKPTFTPGTMQSSLLQAEPGNYQRCNDTGDRKFVEIETGYYMVGDGIYYADKTNLDAWVLLCNDANCGHSPSRCNAKQAMGQIMYKDDRLWYCSTFGTDPTRADSIGNYLVSVAKNGNDKRWEYNFQEEDLAGGAIGFSLI